MSPVLCNVLQARSGKSCPSARSYLKASIKSILSDKLWSEEKLRTFTDTNPSHEFPRIGHTALRR